MSKLRVMQIAEANLQLLLRIFLRLRIEESYENHSSRKGRSIESSLQEKRLIFDLAKQAEGVLSFATCDLESFSDMQLPNIGGIVEECTRENRE